MLLNCDLGESYGSWTMGMDEDVMPHIDQANIACGFHAGDPLTMRSTLALAARHGVSIGAHPAYPDLVGFGRRSMNLSADELIATVHYQVAALEGMALSQGLELAYVKPHGALYNDMMAKPEVMRRYHAGPDKLSPATGADAAGNTRRAAASRRSGRTRDPRTVRSVCRPLLRRRWQPAVQAQTRRCAQPGTHAGAG